MVQITVDFAPAYELIASIKAYTERRSHKILDLGPAWAARVQEQLSPKLRAELEGERNPLSWPLAELLIWQCPGERDPEGFTDWLESLSLEALHARVAPYQPNEARLPDLADWRDGTVRLLRDWHAQYFCHLDPTVLTDLAAERQARQEQAGRLEPMQLIDQATGGILYEPQACPPWIVLIPQYHFSPLSLVAVHRGVSQILYPVAAIPAEPGTPSPALMRLARALADETRLRMLRHLASGSHTFTELVDWSGLAKSTVHHHLLHLRAAGLIRVHHGGSAQGDRYSLHPHAVTALAERLTAFLEGE